MDDAASRRTVLRTGVALGSVGVLGSLAGCADLLGGEDDTDSGAIDYADWLYEPGAVWDQKHYYFTFRDDRDVHDAEEGIDETIYDRLTPGEDSEERELYAEMGIDYGDIRARLATDSAVVFFGEFDGQAVVDELKSSGYTADGDHRDFAMVHRQETREEFGGPREYDQVFGIGDGVAVFSQSTAEAELDPWTPVETAIDAAAGEQTRYVDASEDMARLTEELGTGTTVSGGTRDPDAEPRAGTTEVEGLVARGERVDIDADTTALRAVFVFASEADASVDATETALEENPDRFDLNVDRSFSQNGRVVVASGEAATADAFTSVLVPNLTFDSDYDPESQEVTIVMTAGETVDAGRVRVEGSQVASGYNVTLANDNYLGENRPVTAGDTVTVPLTDTTGSGSTDDFTLQLLWESADGDITRTLFEVSGPEA